METVQCGIGLMVESLRKQVPNPEKGLPEEVFLFATEITPMVNVDLLIRDNNGRILLSWRDDQYHGTGWHVPGGILRVKESFEDRIIETAMSEIGCSVEFSSNPTDIVPIISNERKTRGHFISFIYECRLPKKFEVNNGSRKQNEAGFLQWFEHFPDNMVEEHKFYKKYFL